MRQSTTAVWESGLRAALLFCVLSGTPGFSQEAARPVPTHRDVKYGAHERQALDFYQAPSDRPTPVLVHFHGGGFRQGSKDGINAGLYRLCMERGISFASSNYRL